MTSRERVFAAFEFRAPDRIPRFDNFWEFPEAWAQRLGPAEGMRDISIWTPNEGAFPTHARALEAQGGWKYSVDVWGRTIREKTGTYFVEVMEVPIPVGTDPESVRFDAADLDVRYLKAENAELTLQRLQQDKARNCVFAKTGGPYLRTTFVRGEEQFLMDIAGDPGLARALADKMADHLIAVGLEGMRRWSLHDTGIWIYDDMAHNGGPMFSPDSFEKVFLPGYRRMVEAYKSAGAKYVLVHSDGNILPILDMLIDAGIDGLNPLEKRAGMDATAIRRQYPDLILTGGMCNTDTLVNGPVERIEREARELIDLGREGGVVIGTHSISPEVPLEHFVVYDRICRTYGCFDT